MAIACILWEEMGMCNNGIYFVCPSNENDLVKFCVKVLLLFMPPSKKGGANMFVHSSRNVLPTF